MSSTFYFNKLYSRLLMRNCAAMMVVVLPVALLICGLFFLSRLLSEATTEVIPLRHIFYLFLLTLYKYLPDLLLFSLFISALLVLQQAYLSNEMRAWFAAGLDPRRFVPPLLLYALPGTLIILFCTMSLSPWAAYQLELSKAAIKLDIQPDNFSRQRFSHLPGGRHVYFWRDAESIYVIGNGDDNRREVIFTRQINQRDTKNLTLRDGRLYRYSDADAPPALEIFSFSSLRLSTPEDKLKQRVRGKQWSALDLSLADERAALIWRLNMALAAPALVLAALALMHSRNWRGGRMMIPGAIGLFFLYLHLLRFLKKMMEEYELSFIVGLGAPLLLVAALVGGVALWQRR